MSAASSSSSNDASKINENSYNLFRDSPIRYLGYANEIGESFRYQYPRYVGPSYMVAFGYCLADAISTGYTAYTYNNNKIGHSHNEDWEEKKLQRALIGACDTLLWQSLASVVIPGSCINVIVKLARYTVSNTPRQLRLPVAAVTWLPTMIGLASIPFIIHPIDHSVDFILDNSVRPVYRQHLSASW
jgi:mitochondrial fission process protein 1